KQGINTSGTLKVGKSAQFKDNVTIDGTLSVTDFAVSCIDNLCVAHLSAGDETVGALSVGCDVTVGCDINMPTSTDRCTGNIIKNGVWFLHNFGTDNVFLGEYAGNFEMTGAHNAAVGYGVMYSNTSGTANVAMGYQALLTNSEGNYNTAVGSFTMENNSTGNFNTAVGTGTLFSNTIGSQNIAVGDSAMLFNTTGVNNIAIGSAALANAPAGINNIAIGSSAATHFNGDESYNITIGNAGVAGDNSIIRIGDLDAQNAIFVAGINGTTTGLPAIPVFVDANGQLGTISSSLRFKHEITDIDDVSLRLYQLRPIAFVYNNDASSRQQYGLIAEEVAEIFPEMVIYDEHGQPYTVQYQVLPVLLLNELQKQQAFMKALAENFEKRLAALECA
ncbi:MAG TPA: tail fiber domain-containing protein, partial [Candidatus Babeliales bacterium]|nr:tail fiber domain-containing protein [Candidatus Babeliales bacterium]